MGDNYIFRKGFKSDAEKKATFYREIINISSIAPLPAFQLAEYLNIKILTPSSLFENNDALCNILKNSDEWSALTLPCKSGNRVIIHNDKHSKARQESDLMHEIAHIVCEHKTLENTHLDGLNLLLRDYNETQEKEAEWLGGCLQLPREALIWSLKLKMSHKEIADYFNASQEMVRYRINMTGVKKQLNYTR